MNRKLFLGRSLPSLVSENRKQKLLIEIPRNLKVSQAKINVVKFVSILGRELSLKTQVLTSTIFLKES